MQNLVEHGTTRWAREAMIAAVERSPALVGAHDKAGWLALFTPGGVVEDPVGTPPNRRGARVDARGEDDLGRFYETFIARNAIRFQVAEDLAAGDEVVRDVVIHTRLSTGLAIEVPAHLVYQLVESEGALRIARMRAYWDLRRRSWSALGSGPRGWWTLLVMSGQMLAVGGLRGVLGYSRGLLVGIFGRARRTLGHLADAIAAGDAEGAAALFTDDATVALPVGREVMAARQWIAGLGAGAKLAIDRVTPAGYAASFGFTIVSPSPLSLSLSLSNERGGIALCEFDPRTRRIRSLRLYVREAAT